MTSDSGMDRRQFLIVGGIAGLGLLGAAGCSSASTVKKNRVSDRAAGAFGGAASGFDRTDGSFGEADGRSGRGLRTLTSEAPLPQPFTTALPILPTLKPTGRRNGQSLYEVTEQAAQKGILPGLTTTIWGYDGQFPGPTIEARRGAASRSLYGCATSSQSRRAPTCTAVSRPQHPTDTRRT